MCIALKTVSIERNGETDRQRGGWESIDITSKKPVESTNGGLISAAVAVLAGGGGSGLHAIASSLILLFCFHDVA